jgi:hypothetical protein
MGCVGRSHNTCVIRTCRCVQREKCGRYHQKRLNVTFIQKATPYICSYICSYIDPYPSTHTHRLMYPACRAFACNEHERLDRNTLGSSTKPPGVTPRNTVALRTCRNVSWELPSTPSHMFAGPGAPVLPSSKAQQYDNPRSGRSKDRPDLLRFGDPKSWVRSTTDECPA